MRYVYLYLITAPIFLAIDFIWLGYIARDFYRSRLEGLMLESPNLGIAAGFYAVYVVGIVLFAQSVALADGRWTSALLWGALFGFFAYATYDLTNLATLKNWPLSVSLVDIAWGTALSGVSAAAGFAIANRLGLLAQS